MLRAVPSIDLTNLVIFCECQYGILLSWIRHLNIMILHLNIMLLQNKILILHFIVKI